MNNTKAQERHTECLQQMQDMKAVIDAAPLDISARLLTRYSVILCCGTIERCFKGIISDYFTFHPQVSNFVNRHVYKTSMNPSWDDISGVLKSFDDAWKLQFKQRSKEENKSALNSLVDARNKVAHGENMNHSFNEILQYYNRAWEIIVILDNIVESEDHV